MVGSRKPLQQSATLANALVMLSHVAFSREDFVKFAAGRTVDEIEALLLAGRAFGYDAEVAAREWVAQRRAEQQARADEARLELERRAVRAAERSAMAAIIASAAALLALPISIVALIGWANLKAVVGW